MVYQFFICKHTHTHCRCSREKRVHVMCLVFGVWRIENQSLWDSQNTVNISGSVWLVSFWLFLQGFSVEVHHAFPWPSKTHLPKRETGPTSDTTPALALFPASSSSLRSLCLCRSAASPGPRVTVKQTRSWICAEVILSPAVFVCLTTHISAVNDVCVCEYENETLLITAGECRHYSS